MVLRVGLVGCGNISSIYLENAARFPSWEVVACADLDLGRATDRAERYNVAKACTTAELLADDSIDAVLNLTIPAVHAEIALAAVEAGKHVYNEKPLAIALEDADRLLNRAAARGVRVGCAPDTFLGAGFQQVRSLLDEGRIGSVVAGHAAMLGHGPEGWHPDPHFFFQPGAGPLFDMGPYYLTALVSLLGPVTDVTGVARASFPERIVGSGPKAGERIPVNTPTHTTAILEFASGAVVTLTTSFDVWTRVNTIELFGSEGTVQCPDPNTFGGPIAIRIGSNPEWHSDPVEGPTAVNSRGLGLADMAVGIATGRPHRASGELAHHVLEVMHTIYAASEQGRRLSVRSKPARPEPFDPSEVLA